MNRKSKQTINDKGHADNTDDQLRKLLQTWSGIDPKEDFEKEVWRRISQTSTKASASSPKRAWLLHPTYFRRVAAAILVGLFMGTSFGWLSSSDFVAEKRAEEHGFSLFYGRSLTSSYSSLVKGEH